MRLKTSIVQSRKSKTYATGYNVPMRASMTTRIDSLRFIRRNGRKARPSRNTFPTLPPLNESKDIKSIKTFAKEIIKMMESNTFHASFR